MKMNDVQPEGMIRKQRSPQTDDHKFVPVPSAINTSAICSHLYSSYLTGQYADLIVRFQFKQTGHNFQSPVDGILYKLHKIIAIRSPFLAALLMDHDASNNDGYQQITTLTISTSDANLTPAGLGVAFGHLYAPYYHHLLQGQPEESRATFYSSVLGASTLLQLSDLCQIVTGYIKQSVSSDSIVQYALIFNDNLYQNSQELKDFMFTYLCNGIVTETTEKYGLLWDNENGKAYQFLTNLFAELPFEWLKSIIESKHFLVPREVNRFTFAKHVVEIRARQNQQNNNFLTEENVLFSFAGTNQQGVTLVRKTKLNKSMGLNNDAQRRVWKASQ
ncbi:hypothetical protein HDV02_000383 [Globomyces sp. JEL0801]|nr:hypothetical protein HDV02_000383 [Globomyces sp. JEL0801]